MDLRHSLANLLVATVAVSCLGCGGGRGATSTSIAVAPTPVHGPARSEGARPACDCKAPPGLTRLQVRSDEVQGIPYLEVVYGAAGVDDPLPMVVGIHGMGDQPRLPQHPRWSDLGHPYRIVMPRGPLEHRQGYKWFEYRVNDGEHEGLAEALAEQADRVARAVTELRERLPTVGKPIVTGGSQGGMMTFALAVRHPELVGGAVPVMGWLPPSLVPEHLEEGVRYPRIRSGHGTADRVVPLEPTRHAVKQLEELGLDVELHTYEGLGHEMNEDLYEDVRRWLAAMVAAQL